VGDPAQPPIPRALTALGPAYIKFGQILSTRPDIVGDDLARQLTVLQDKLPPFPETEARAAVERELGRPLAAVFADFEPAVAAASLAQVHRATLRDTGRPVAVKVLRPGSSAPSCATWTPSTSPPARSRFSRPSPAASSPAR
jgi:ubiquinone biosynthesis protein